MSARSRAGWTSKSTSFQYAIIFRMSSWLSASKTITSGASLLSEPQKPTVRRPAAFSPSFHHWRDLAVRSTSPSCQRGSFFTNAMKSMGGPPCAPSGLAPGRASGDGLGSPDRAPWAHGYDPRAVPRSLHEEGLRAPRHGGPRRRAAGDARVGRLRRHARALQHGEGPRQGEEPGARPARGALDPGPRQPLPLRAGARADRRGDGEGRRRAHRRAREEVPRPGQVPVPAPGRGARHVQGGARERAGDVSLASRPRGAVEERAMAEPAVATTGRRWVFEGRELTMPVVVRDAASAAATYLVPSAAARRLLPGAELEVVELLPGRALFSIAAIDYRDNDLGDYHEVSLALFVRARSDRAGVPYLGTALEFLRNRVATWIWKLPVDQRFTCAAGRGIWGFPKSVEQIAFEDVDGRRRCRLVMDGRHVLTFSVSRGGGRTLPVAAMATYTYIDGVLHRTPFVSGATGVGIHLGGAELLLGDHPLAAELGSLGLPKGALMSVWMEHSHGRFEAPAPC